MEDLSSLIKQRGRTKAKLTAFSNYLALIAIEPERQIEINSRLEKAEELWNEFELLQNKIEDLDNSDMQAQQRTTFEDSYHELISKARQIKLKDHPMYSQPAAGISQAIIQPHAAAINETAIVQTRAILPTIDLPKFDGNYERWVPFRDLFESLIATNSVLTAVQKLYYLRSALTGEAAKIIASLEITNDNYVIAWELLKNRYENKRLIVQYLIQALLDLASINKESYSDLRQLVDNASQHIQTLTKLEQPVASWGTLLIHIILPKVDKGSRREWELKRSNREEFPTLAEFMDFLTNRSMFLEALSHTNRNAQPPSDARSNKVTQPQNKNVAQAYVSTDRGACAMCSKNHKLHECKAFLSLSAEDRSAEVKKKKLCFKCLNSFHGRNCKAPNCKECPGYHNTLLHRLKTTSETSNSSNSKTESIESATANQGVAVVSNKCIATLNNHNLEGGPQVLLSTAVVLVRDRDGASHECRALLDSGSQSNFITKELSKKLNLKQKTINMSIGGISNIPIKIAQQTQATIQSRVNEFKTDLHFLIIDKITERLPIHKINKTALDIPNNLELADPTCHIPSDVDMLLGASIFWDLISGGQVRGSNQSIVFQEKRLGWIAAGPMETTNACQQKRSYCGMTTTLHKQLEKFWSIEEMVQSPPVSEEEKICEQHFLETHARDSEGRFIVQLPLKGNIDELGESMETATKRFKAIERKLKRQPELKQTYSSFISEYLNLNHMEEVLQKDAQCKLSYYLPHHAVTKEDSETTKVRVVFDASCKSSTGISLNDCLRVGPTIQQDLFSIILRLRQHRYAMSADIAKMYRQVKVIDEHTHLQRILWRWNEDEPIRTFRLKTVTYGLACSSFLAIRCLQEIASQHQKECPEASRAILNDFYVDDLLTGASTVKELKQLRQSTTKILNSAGFELRKWRSNIPEISDKNTSNNSMVEIGEPTKILGLYWDVNQDVFQYRLRLSEETSKITKRKVLTQVSQIYDPLGWLGPSIVKAKILLQRLWQTNKGWDEPISGEMLEMWKQWRSQIHNVQQISIPRRVLENQQDRTELHGFCDASEAAYGACLYIRSSTDENTYNTRLLCAKSRIAPLKKVSLPRLELCGAVLLARLSEKASQALNITVHNTYYWSDSTITLSWIGNEPNKWHTFVANRVAEIQRITNKAAWYYVKSEDNPADPLSRGISPDKLKSQTIWWEGPKFLAAQYENAAIRLQGQRRSHA
ncbi:PREDICTED: uncharacterized protein LOC108762191 [Trachymyrmex cornetzi]|uniref:uncharacterized protein LOC108762191 n=1 Tax=Trachymyrmex cornetzi TaxID=471704 RepID=UPI00084F2EA2|nr:PREDICTED: uncharacterized protein LOC108762191 [Trachymyrmex cornetzi]